MKISKKLTKLTLRRDERLVKGREFIQSLRKKKKKPIKLEMQKISEADEHEYQFEGTDAEKILNETKQIED